MKKIKFHIVDAFIDPEKPFSGNPAAVIILPNNNYISDEIKQKIATEFNLSETVYVSKIDDQCCCWSIRWFTPKTEVKLCGHATIAVSYILSKLYDEKILNFINKFGNKFMASYNVDDDSIELNFPSNDTQKTKDSTWLQQITDAMFQNKNNEHENYVDSIHYSINTEKLLIRLNDNIEDDDYLEKIKPNFEKLLQIKTGIQIKGVIITQKSNKNNIHFRSRYFAPWVGINEDPVTGSAHTVLTPFWSRCFQNEDNKIIKKFHAKQCSQRSGLIDCQLKFINNEQRVLLNGKARIFCQGEIELY